MATGLVEKGTQTLLKFERLKALNTHKPLTVHKSTTASSTEIFTLYKQYNLPIPALLNPEICLIAPQNLQTDPTNNEILHQNTNSAHDENHRVRNSPHINRMENDGNTQNNSQNPETNKENPEQSENNPEKSAKNPQTSENNTEKGDTNTETVDEYPDKIDENPEKIEEHRVNGETKPENSANNGEKSDKNSEKKDKNPAKYEKNDERNAAATNAPPGKAIYPLQIDPHPGLVERAIEAHFLKCKKRDRHAFPENFDLLRKMDRFLRRLCQHAMTSSEEEMTGLRKRFLFRKKTVTSSGKNCANSSNTSFKSSMLNRDNPTKRSDFSGKHGSQLSLAKLNTSLRKRPTLNSPPSSNVSPPLLAATSRRSLYSSRKTRNKFDPQDLLRPAKSRRKVQQLTHKLQSLLTPQYAEDDWVPVWDGARAVEGVLSQNTLFRHHLFLRDNYDFGLILKRFGISFPPPPGLTVLDLTVGGLKISGEEGGEGEGPDGGDDGGFGKIGVKIENTKGENIEKKTQKKATNIREKAEMKTSHTAIVIKVFDLKHDTLTKNQKVTSIQWSPKLPDVLVAAYSTKSADPSAILVWSFKTPQLPIRVFSTPAGVLCLSISPIQSSLVCAGMENGRIGLWNMCDSGSHWLAEEMHTDEVYDICWSEKLGDIGLTNIYSIAGDGTVRVCRPSSKGLDCVGTVCLRYLPNPFLEATVSKQSRAVRYYLSEAGDRMCTKGGLKAGATAPLTSAEKTNAREKGAENNGTKGTESNTAVKLSDKNLFEQNFFDNSESTLSDFQTCIGTCITCPSNDSHTYLIGTANGLIHLCSNSYNESYTRTYYGHISSITNIRCNPFCPQLFLSSSSDSSIRLWTVQKDINPISGDKAESSKHAVNRTADNYHINDEKTQNDEAITIFQSSAPIPASVLSIDWHPTISTAFLAAYSDGRLELWDFLLESVEPIFTYRFTTNSDPEQPTGRPEFVPHNEPCGGENDDTSPNHNKVGEEDVKQVGDQVTKANNRKNFEKQRKSIKHEADQNIKKTDDESDNELSVQNLEVEGKITQEEKEKTQHKPQHPPEVTCAQFAPLTNLIAAATNNGNITIFHLNTNAITDSPPPLERLQTFLTRQA